MRRAIIIAFIILLTGTVSYGLDSPHNIANTINCESCHFKDYVFSPFWGANYTPSDIDDTPYNKICWYCHTVTTGGPFIDQEAPYVKTHSSLSTDNGYGDWTVECRVCHDSHYNKQYLYFRNTDPNLLYLARGTVDSFKACTAADLPDCTDGESLITYSGVTDKAGWDYTRWGKKRGEDYRGATICPNINAPFYNYPVISATDTKIRIAGDITAGYIAVGNTFGIVYSQLMKDRIIYTDKGINSQVKFFDNTGLGSFRDGDAIYNGICEVCHTLTNHFRNNGTVNVGGGTDHIPLVATNCTDCHVHTEGFKASCNSCHGSPPVDAGTLVSSPNPTGSATAGVHNTHVSTENIACAGCHYNSVGSGSTHNDAPNPPQDITMGFYNFGTPYQGGTYNGQSVAQYNTTVTNPVTTVTNTGTAGAGDLTCSNVYCHGNYNGSGLNASPVWDDATTAPCGSCHGASNTTVPASGSHARHAASSGINRNYSCILCHKDILGGTGPASYTIADKNQHISGYVDWKFDTTDSRLQGGSETYGIATGTAVPSDGTTPRAYGQCNNIYCHSNVQPDGGTGVPDVYASPAWGGVVNCGGCHNQDGSHSIGPVMDSGSHTMHLSYKFTAFSNYKKCEICHKFGTADITVDECVSCHSENEPTLHANGAVNLIFYTAFTGASAAYNGTAAPGDGYSDCDNTYCHSNGTSVSTGSIPNNSTVNWGTAGPLACNACHENPPAYANGSPKANSHAKHSGYTCNKCHNTTTNDGTTISSKVTHVNRAYNVDQGGGVSFTYSYVVTGGTCSSISCHFNGNATWGGTINCGDCHAVPPATGAHAIHTASTGAAYGDDGFNPTVAIYNFNCGNCHPLDSNKHGDGTIDIELYNALASGFKANNPATASKSGSGNTTVCGDIYCHSDGAASGRIYQPTPQWGGVFAGDRCAGCHGNSPSTGSHSGHVVGIHYQTIYDDDGIGLEAQSGAVGSGAAHGDPNTSTTINCNICHTNTLTKARNRENTICNTCHSGDAASTVIASADLTKTFHINAARDVAFANVTFRSKAQIRDDITTVTELNTYWARQNNYKAAVNSHDSSKNPLAGTASWDGTSCSTTACHNGNSVTWGDSGVSCDSCHTGLP